MGTLFADEAKSWELDRDGSYRRIAPPIPNDGAALNSHGPSSLSQFPAPLSSALHTPAAQSGPLRAQQRFIERARERAKGGDPLGRSSNRFHILTVPSSEEERKLRRAKERQRKRRPTLA
jgi:hypothetical protein